MFSTPVRTLCNGDYDRNLKFMCWDWNNSGQHSLIGEFYTTLKVLTEGPGATNRYKLIHPEKQVSSHLLNSVSFILWYLDRGINGGEMEELVYPVIEEHCIQRI